MRSIVGIQGSASLSDGRQNATFPPKVGQVSARSLPMDRVGRPASYVEANTPVLLPLGTTEDGNRNRNNGSAEVRLARNTGTDDE